MFISSQEQLSAIILVAQNAHYTFSDIRCFARVNEFMPGQKIRLTGLIKESEMNGYLH